MTTSESKGRFFTKRIDSHNESNRFESRIGMLYWEPNILNNCYELSGGCPPEPPTRGSAPGPRWGTLVSQTPCAPTSKSWLRHCYGLNWPELVDPVTRRVYWPRASRSRLCFVLIGCSETRTVSARLVLNTCITMRLFTLELENSSPRTGVSWVQFTCCEQAFTVLHTRKHDRRLAIDNMLQSCICTCSKRCPNKTTHAALATNLSCIDNFVTRATIVKKSLS